MLLSELLKDVENSHVVGGDVEISGVEYDSRRVKDANLFCCIVGTIRDGHDFAAEAVQKGAAALLVQRELPIDVPQVVVPNVRKAMALCSATFFGNPARSLVMIGVTGTNGKTTTTYMIKAIAEALGKKVGLIGTIFNLIGDERVPSDRTTPESADLHAILAHMLEQGVDTVVMEVSSHSLDQYRVGGITFDVAAFTNFTQDHLDYHKTLENYLAAKRKLFKQCRCAAYNADDPAYTDIMGTDYPLMSFGVRESADISASEIEFTARGLQFDMATPAGPTRINMKLPGLFNVFNALCATAVGQLLGYPIEAIKQGLESISSVSGRMEPLDTQGRPYSVLLDYAHTPDAIENVLKAVRQFTSSRLITVFGCGGDRDRAKRPLMGEVAGRYSDYLVITSDNPRSEDPSAIIDAIEEGVKRSGCDYIVIENRYEAIAYALGFARRNDVVLLAGKGHETYQEIDGIKHHFDEKEIVAELLGKMADGGNACKS